MTYEEALKQAVVEGAIRVYRLSDNLAFAYRYHEGSFQARGLYGVDGDVRLGDHLVSAEDYSSQDGWHQISALPWQAQAIDLDDARENPGYEMALFQQCYTCKKEKALSAFGRAVGGRPKHLSWECKQCHERRMRELSVFRKMKNARQGTI